MKSKLIILLIAFSLIAVFSLIASCSEVRKINDKNLSCGFSSEIECLNIKYTGNQVFIGIRNNESFPMDVYEVKAYGAGTCGREMYNNEKFPFQIKAGENGTIDIVCNNIANLNYHNYTSQLRTVYGFIE